MFSKNRHNARVTQAHEQAGSTKATLPVCIVMVVVFTTTILSLPMAQLWFEPELILRDMTQLSGKPTQILGTDDAWIGEVPIFSLNRRLLEMIKDLNHRIDNESLLALHLRPIIQTLLTRWAATGNENVYIGRRGWLYYAPDIEHLAGPGFLDAGRLARRLNSGDNLTKPPQPDPRTALIQFNEVLADRGISLVILPTPVKPSIHPEHLTRPLTQTPLQNVSFARFVKDLQSAGIKVFDPAPLLAELRNSGEQTYLATDTHWHPDAVVAVATALAAFLTSEISLPEDDVLLTERQGPRVTNQGDTAALLNLTDDLVPHTSETVTLRQILTPALDPWRPDQSADVLLLGDSFSNIYSLPSLGWGESAGLAEQLSASLGRPIDRITQNDNGAFASRERLARSLAGGQDRLAGKRVIIFQFTTRELTHGDWRLIDFDRPLSGVTAAVLTPSPNQRMLVSGVVQQKTVPPRPETVPYRDHIVAIHLSQISSSDQGVDANQALIYLSSMENNVWTDAASLAVGQTVTLTIRPWREVAQELDGVTRSELAEGDVMYAEPWWGELVEP